MTKRSAVVTVLLVAFLAILGTTVVVVKPWSGHGQAKPGAALYHCPMHPTVTSGKPGSCPICGMDLVPVATDTPHDAETASHAGAAQVATFHCPMHPTVTSGKPGSCPICGMDLVPVATDPGPDDHAAPQGRTRTVWRSTMNPNEVSDRPGKDTMGMDMVAEEVPIEDGASGGGPADLAKIRMSPQKRQLIGVRTSEIRKLPFVRSIRAVGRVTADEKRLRQVTTKIDGYVERLYANAVGEVVRAGQPLLEVYSPELLASQNEYLVARAARERTAGSSSASIAGYGDDLVASARRRLQLFDVSDDQIDRLERTGRPERVITIHAPISGVITARNVAQGQKISSGATLLEVVDLSRVWVLASVYEYELPFVREGQAATASLTYLPGRSFDGRVSFVYPTLDAQTRTVMVRVEVPNPRLDLKPDMFADVLLRSDLGERLAVPDSAVLETGTRSIAFVESEPGVFEPREVEIGLRLEADYEVLKGLAAGERVVVSGNFLIDSESRLKAALAGMTAAAESKSAPSGHAH